MLFNCIFHEDKTASMKVYEEGFFCFGCGAHGSNDILEQKIPGVKVKYYEKPPTNIKAEIEKIKKLPIRCIRGIDLHYDSSGYYILYPNNLYYIKRFWDPVDNRKYLCPSGLAKPPLVIHRVIPGVDAKTLLVVEGQINALTAFNYSDNFKVIVSPGGATDLVKPYFVNLCLLFDRVCVMVDKDEAGIKAGQILVNSLKERNKVATLYPMEQDLNAILMQHAESGVEEEISRAMAQLQVS